ncbi:MAG: glutamate formiminotransferase / 5-formyltetrahydrofolate cyclo-ligase [Actinomycetota bacterium]|jgi:glutamate formiminotransferase|nr:glutamate formiminotransferase / 5-formyltetrahydrofolate cyclo-ligase [Actinomycetota bacterium]
MPFLAIPNISTGAPGTALSAAVTAVEGARGRLLDVHSDKTHNRSVLTVTAADDALIDAMVALAVACKTIDLRSHEGVHPRVGCLDVCPFVPQEASLERAIELAHEAGTKIASAVDAPVFFYGAASLRPETRELPDIRRGDLDGLVQRIDAGFTPDRGPARIDPSYGAVLVGARGPLIAFNVWLGSDLATARAIASKVREPHRIRALGLEMGDGRCQVSMNLVAPDQVGIDDAFERVDRIASTSGAEVIATEIVGLVEQRFLPKPDAKAARLFIEPGRSLESALND